jgi:ABC-type branched-subunit amino acid transport system permease subunit
MASTMGDRLRATGDGMAAMLEPVRARRGTLAYNVVAKAIVVVVFLAFVEKLWHPVLGTYIQGSSIGLLYGLLGVGIILIHRTNRIINFAAASLGAVPAIGFALLMALKGLSWWIAFPAALVCSAALGFVVDIAVIRRFDKAPRLILTVATIGVSQILAYVGLLLPGWLGNDALLVSYQSPFTPTKFHFGHTMLTGDYAFGIVLMAVATAALATFLRYTRVGIAMRASAENADRAALLGIPVRRVEAVAWTLAGLLAGIAVFVRSGMIGVPVDGSLGPRVLLFALTAAVIARMESMVTCLVAGAGIGLMATSAASHYGEDSLVAGLMVVVVLGALLLQRSRIGRAHDTGVSTWQAVREFRPIPQELAGLSTVRAVRVALGLVVAVGLVVLPLVIGAGRVGYACLVLVGAIVAVSLVVLSGWAGQISLGQFGIVGVGAAVAGKLAGQHNLDFFLVLVVGIVVGALVSTLLGLPALRIPGLYLAVATLAFAGAMELVVLDRHYWIGKQVMSKDTVHIDPPVLWDRITMADPVLGSGSSRNFYWVCLVALALTVLVARSYRRSRAGRAVVAIRDNPRAASSYSINPARTKLAAFAVSGGMAAMAGVLMAYQQGAVDKSPYGITASTTIFVVTAIGGLTSLAGAVVGAIVLESIRLYGGDYVKNLGLLVTGPGLLLILLFLPGGLGEGMYRIRDRWLRRMAVKRDIHVPSLVADRRQEAAAEQSVVIEAEEHVESVEGFDVLNDRRITCPVCGAVLPVEDAPDHEHFKIGAEL